MTNMLEELWFGCIEPSGRATDRRDKPTSFICTHIKKADKIMYDNLNEEQLDNFLKYKGKMDEIISECEQEAFMDGYKIATRLMISCFSKDKNIFDDII